MCMTMHTIAAIPGKRNTYARWIADKGGARSGDVIAISRPFRCIALHLL